jgi:hypothetical protein
MSNIFEFFLIGIELLICYLWSGVLCKRAEVSKNTKIQFEDVLLWIFAIILIIRISRIT